MYAIVEIAGQQFKVEKDQQIFVHRLEGKEGDQVAFDQVLLIDNDGKIAVGAPAVPDAAITAKIVEHLRGDKIIVFKKKRRKGYQKRNGHRQDFTKIQIEAILEKGGSKAAKPAAKAAAKPAPKAEANVETKAPVKKAAPKAKTSTTEVKTPAKKTAPKKAETKAKAPASKAVAKSTSKKTTAKPKAAPAKKASPKKDEK
ncbi:MAG: 50S ribosomal protein L21 [Vicingaceae bacterium]